MNWNHDFQIESVKSRIFQQSEKMYTFECECVCVCCRKNSEKLSKQFTDRPVKPLDEAIYWVEYIARHGKGALRSPLVDMPWWQTTLLDVYGFIILVLLVVYYVLKFSLKRVYRFCCSARKPTSHPSSKSKKNRWNRWTFQKYWQILDGALYTRMNRMNNNSLKCILSESIHCVQCTYIGTIVCQSGYDDLVECLWDTIICAQNNQVKKDFLRLWVFFSKKSLYSLLNCIGADPSANFLVSRELRIYCLVISRNEIQCYWFHLGCPIWKNNMLHQHLSVLIFF